MKSLRSVLVLLFALNILGGVGLWFAYNMMSDAKVLETEMRGQLLAESQKNDQLVKLKRTLSAAQKDREELESFLYSTSDEDQIEFISSIEQMGTSSSGALVEATQLELTKVPPPVLRGDFAVRGTWGELFHVLRLIEESPSRINVNRFEVKAGTQSDWVGVIKIELVSIRDTK